MFTRRRMLAGLGAMLAMPAVARASSLMDLRGLPLSPKILRVERGFITLAEYAELRSGSPVETEIARLLSETNAILEALQYEDLHQHHRGRGLQGRGGVP